jgi:hypothetical protein
MEGILHHRRRPQITQITLIAQMKSFCGVPLLARYSTFPQDGWRGAPVQIIFVFWTMSRFLPHFRFLKMGEAGGGRFCSKTFKKM